MYIFSRENIANCVSLHFFDASKVDYKNLFDMSERWMIDNGFEPNRMDGKGKKIITFSRGKKSLEKEDYKWVQERGFWLASLPPDDQVKIEGNDYKSCVCISRPHEGKSRNSFFIAWDNALLGLQPQFTKKLLRGLTMFFRPEYGYVFQRSFGLGPFFYSRGTIMGIPFDDKKPRGEIAAWSNIAIGNRSDYQPHFIRDVYRLNFLSPVHLNGPVADGTLRDWINASPERGTLEPVIGDLWCWEVDEANIPKVREDLKPHNILIAFMDY